MARLCMNLPFFLFFSSVLHSFVWIQIYMGNYLFFENLQDCGNRCWKKLSRIGYRYFFLSFFFLNFVKEIRFPSSPRVVSDVWVEKNRCSPSNTSSRRRCEWVRRSSRWVFIKYYQTKNCAFTNHVPDSMDARWYYTITYWHLRFKRHVLSRAKSFPLPHF